MEELTALPYPLHVDGFRGACNDLGDSKRRGKRKVKGSRGKGRGKKEGCGLTLNPYV